MLTAERWVSCKGAKQPLPAPAPAAFAALCHSSSNRRAQQPCLSVHPSSPCNRQAGDYYDVLNLPMMSQGATARIRLQPGEFPGYAV